ncbi:MAG: hypothetical protein ACLRX6_03035 [Limosilactobacillus pontis]|uniref:hypothetical protein n=1 Tax=Limosilactobacillus pontis TaxID=35787 RepID=UPI0039A1A5C5
MKKIIKGKLYNTDSAKKMASYEFSSVNQNDHYIEELYRKRTGEYFLHGVGGPGSPYAQSAYRDDSALMGGEDVIPLSLRGARNWSEKHLDADDYEAVWGDTSEGDEKAKDIHVQISSELASRLASKVEKTGLSQREIINKALDAYL